MKRILFAAATLAAVLFSAQPSKAVDVSVNFFYDNLGGGSWMEVGDYGYVWQPDVAVSDPAWRPYADGYWAYTDLGWTWVSYEDFGWATYHYGRWARLSDYGWVWVPGRDEDLEWGPAWVSWRTGGDYIGWAPLPPEVYYGRPVTGDIDIQFNIGPAYYNFVDVRYIGEPVLRERIVDYRQNVTYINQTVNITNITYKNKVVYNYGPDVTVINARASRPIQRLKLERQENADVRGAAKSGGLMKPQGDKLIVSAPMHIKKADKQVAPPQVKTKVAKANLDRGWSVVGDDNAQKQFKEQMKQQQGRKAEILERAKTGGGVQAGASTGAEAGASAAASTNASVAPLEKGEKGKGRGRRGVEKADQQNAAAGANAEAGAAASASVAPGASAVPNEPKVGGSRGRPRGRNADQVNPSNPPAGGAGAEMDVSAGAGVSPSAVPEDQTRSGGKKGRRLDQQPQQAQQFDQGNSNENQPNPQDGHARRGRRADQTLGGGTQGQGNQPNEMGQGRRMERGNRGEDTTRSEQTGHGQGQGQQGVQGPQGIQGQGRGRPEGSRSKSEPEASPSVSPQ